MDGLGGVDTQDREGYLSCGGKVRYSGKVWKDKDRYM